MSIPQPPRPEEHKPPTESAEKPDDQSTEDPAGALGAMAAGDHDRWDDQAEPDTAADSSDTPGADAPAEAPQQVVPDVSAQHDSVDPEQAFGEHVGSRSPDRRQIGAGPRRFVPTKFHYTAVRASYIVGGLLLIPGIWAVLALLKVYGVIGLAIPMTDASSARARALLMLLCWPVGLALLGGAMWFGRMLRRYEQASSRGGAAGR